MVKQKIKVGSYYEFSIHTDRKIVFAVMYGFDTGKNTDVYALMIYTKEKIFEFPVQERTFDQWVAQGRIMEITSDEALRSIM